MSAQLPPPAPPYPAPPVRQNSGLAIASLISALLGWSVLPVVGTIVAIITGHMARKEIREQPDRLDGDVMAVIGLVLGWGQVVLVVLLIAAAFLFFGGIAWLAYLNQG